MTNGTTLPSINGTRLPLNNTERQPPSACQHSFSTGGLNCRCDDASQHPPQPNYPHVVWVLKDDYANVREGPIVYIKGECGVNKASPGYYPLFKYNSNGLCQDYLSYSDEYTGCQMELYEIGEVREYQAHQVLDPEDFISEGGWLGIFGGGCGSLAQKKCFSENGACKEYPMPITSSDDDWHAPSTQVFQAVDSTTGTTRIEGFVTVVTSITIGTNGLPTTFVQTTSLGGSVSTFITSRTILITAVKSAGASIWTGVSTSTIDALRPGITNHPTTITLRNQLGVPTGTVTEYLETLPNLDGITNHPTTMTLRNQLGVPTGTVTEYLETLVDSDGLPTATLVVSLETLTDPKGYPTKTEVEFSATGSSLPTNFPTSTSANANYVSITRSRYFAGSFVPVLLRVLVSIVIQLVDKNLKSMLPVFALTRPKGASATDSLCMIPGGLIPLPRSFGLLY